MADGSMTRGHRIFLVSTSLLVLVVLLSTFYMQLRSVMTVPFFGTINSCHPLVLPSSSSPLLESGYKDFTPTTLKDTNSKYAFVTILSLDKSVEQDPDVNKNNHFVACRLLAYQILHATETRSDNIPFIVMTVPGTPEREKQRLRKDGAIVLEIEHVTTPEWMVVEPGRWSDMFDKLRAWELTQFERILFLDADVVLTEPLDHLFVEMETQQSDPTLATMRKKRSDGQVEVVKRDDDTQVPVPPSDYVFTATHELTWEHHWPPVDVDYDYYNKVDDYFNAGFFVLKPSMEMQRYYLDMMDREGTYGFFLMEQDFLNYVHRPDGPVPWKALDPIWNVHFPSQADIDGGVRSLHSKWWQPVHGDIGEYLKSRKYRMEGYFEAWDNLFLT